MKIKGSRTSLESEGRNSGEEVVVGGNFIPQIFIMPTTADIFKYLVGPRNFVVFAFAEDYISGVNFDKKIVYAGPRSNGNLA